MKRKEDKGTVTSVELKNIPKNFPDYTDRRDLYNLVGVIRFLGHPGDEKNGLGHYTAICSRQNKWLEFNHLNKTKVNRMNDNNKICPDLIIYARTEGGTQ